MNILIVGSNDIWAIEQYYYKHLNNIAGVDAEIFSTSRFKQKYLNVVRRVERRFLPSKNSLHHLINKALLSTVEKERPDVILVFKGMEVYPETLKKINRIATTTNYNPDHPFIFSSRGSGNQNIVDSIGLYHMHFSYHRDVCKTIKKKFNIPCHWLPFGYELDPLMYELAKENLMEQQRVCFVGNPDEKRLKMIQQMNQKGILIDVYGNHWEKLVRNLKYVNAFPPVYGQVFWEKLKAYRIQLNIFRPHNEYSHNMRSFEVPAVGGIGLMPDSPDHRAFFEAQKEIFLYKSDNQCLEQVKNLLNLSEEDAKQIRQAARKRSVHSGYDYQHRAQALFEHLNAL